MQTGITHDAAKAEATQDYKGNDTVTVSATISLGQNNSQTTVVQLTRSAANSLLSDLLLVLEPVPPTFDLTVETTDSFDEHENVTYLLRNRRLDVAGDNGHAIYNFDRVLRVTAVPHQKG